jgi:hypothetical protein
MRKIVALLLLLAAPRVFAQLSPGRGASADTVVVSRRALTISFPLDNSSSIPKRGEPLLGPNVTLAVDLRQMSSTLRMKIVEPASDITYRSALRPMTCQVLTDTYSCRDSTTLEITDGRLVITVRDSAMLALLFADHPMEMILSAFGPARAGTLVVRYVDPQLLPPSKEALADLDRELGRDGWSPWRRAIVTSSFGMQDTVWLQAGERTTATVIESQNRPTDSFNWRSDFVASGWKVSDSSVVRLEPSTEHVSKTIVALHPGRSTVTAQGLRGPSDDLPRSTRVHDLTQNVVVTNRLARVEITPRPSTIVAGSTFGLTARVIDETGTVVSGAPVNFYVIYDTPDEHGWDGKRYGLASDTDLRTPGHRRFIARFSKLADTLDAQVVPR